MIFTKTDYAALNSRQQEIFNFQKVSSLFADYGFTTIKLSDDWMGADFLAISFDGTQTLKVQLKSRLTFDKKYIGKDIYICFRDRDSDSWYVYPHDEFLQEIEPDIAHTESWKNNGGYSYPTISEKNKFRMMKYKI